MKKEISFHFLFPIQCRIISVSLVAKWLKKRSPLVSSLGISQPAWGQEGLSRAWKQEPVGFGELDSFLQFWKPNRLRPCRISQHLLCASASAERLVRLCSDYSSYCLLALSHCPTETIRLAGGHHNPSSCGQVCGIPGRPPSVGPREWRAVSRRRLAERTGEAVRTGPW